MFGDARKNYDCGNARKVQDFIIVLFWSDIQYLKIIKYQEMANLVNSFKIYEIG